MAIFEGKDASSTKKSYVALLDTEGELVAFVSPVKGVTNELLVESLKSKGLNAEIRESKPDIVSLSL